MNLDSLMESGQPNGAENTNSEPSPSRSTRPPRTSQRVSAAHMTPQAMQESLQAQERIDEQALLASYAPILEPFLMRYGQRQRNALLQADQNFRLAEEEQQLQLATHLTHWAGNSVEQGLARLADEKQAALEEEERRRRRREHEELVLAKRRAAQEDTFFDQVSIKSSKSPGKRERPPSKPGAEDFLNGDQDAVSSPAPSRPTSPFLERSGKRKRLESRSRNSMPPTTIEINALDDDHRALSSAASNKDTEDFSDTMLSPPLSPANSAFDDDNFIDGDFDLQEDHEFRPKGNKRGPYIAKMSTKTPEETERKIWAQIAHVQIPKAAKLRNATTSSRVTFNKRISVVVAREARRGINKTKSSKEIQTKAKRVMREMLIFWKGNEKKEREGRKVAEKSALDKARKEEEMRDAKRAARKLNFLITQTELYSHFVGSKMNTKDAENSAETTATSADAHPQDESRLKNIMAKATGGATLEALDFDAEDESNLEEHARRNAEAAVNRAKAQAAAFDASVAEDQANARPNNPNLNPNATLAEQFDAEMDLQHPTEPENGITIQQPKMLNCSLKEYQLKGLNWLANLYEQGINGILADEMGLGKTVQSISLMAYLAERHNIWGPFLVIAPASTLHNWQQEITRFVPGLKALPYWGNVKDRTVLRKFWNRKSLRYDKDAPFHVLVTSYQLVVADEKYFQRVKWQYMVLDEAQAIKSSSSARWKTLLGFNCRNRLLLTGTPIQNSMQELWALLHFIMPSLFDSHDEFSEWFSKDIENTAEKNGIMNVHQLRRLHMILKPFMLRRIKKNVQNELGEKIEIDIKCDLTPRQRFMYQTLRENMSINELIQRATSLSADDAAVKRLMNLIMQFRKVCNHPELFERADIQAPLSFVLFHSTRSQEIAKENVLPLLELPYSTHSELLVKVPKCFVDIPADTRYTDQLFDIWQSRHLCKMDAFSCRRISQMSPGESAQLASNFHNDQLTSLALFNKLQVQAKPIKSAVDLQSPLARVWETYLEQCTPARSDELIFLPAVVAPPAEIYASDKRFLQQQQGLCHDQEARDILYGLSHRARESELDVAKVNYRHPGLPPFGILAELPKIQQMNPPMRVPKLAKLILDSGKLAKLDELLPKLRAEGHRCLVYFQMTRMIDLMEEYLAFRQYKYLRLDGSSSISERRDMVMDWQTRPDLFIFLLSTRAGGLGINLTAADTVIFYDSDWNPSNDAQAMDRAHRLGQTKQVTVYRLVTAGTIDERILQLARNKKTVQDAVVGSSSAQTNKDQAGATEVVSLLLDDNELQEQMRMQELKRQRMEQKQIEDGKKGVAKREENRKLREAQAAERQAYSGWDAAQDDDDDAFGFFSSKAPARMEEDENFDEEDMPASNSAKAPIKKTASSKPKSKPKVSAPGGTKRPAAAMSNAQEDAASADGQPKKKRARRSRAELEELDRLGLDRRTGKPKKAKAPPQVSTFSTSGPPAL